MDATRLAEEKGKNLAWAEDQLTNRTVIDSSQPMPQKRPTKAEQKELVVKAFRKTSGKHFIRRFLVEKK